MEKKEKTQIAVGAVLLVVGTVITLGATTGLTAALPPLLTSGAMLAMAAGALLVGISGEDGRPV